QQVFGTSQPVITVSDKILSSAQQASKEIFTTMDLDVLRNAPLFTHLDDEVFSALTAELTEVELSRGASVFHEGDDGDQLYVILSGKIKLGRTAPDGRENL